MALFNRNLINAPYSWCYAKNHAFYFIANEGDKIYAPCDCNIKGNVMTVDDIDITFFNVDIRDGKYSEGSVLGLAKGNVGIAVQKAGEYQDAFCYLVRIDGYVHKEPESEQKASANKKASTKKKASTEE